MPMSWDELMTFVLTGARAVADTDLSQVRYGDPGTALGLGVVIGLALAVTTGRLLFMRRHHSRSHSGHVIDREHRKGLAVRVIHTLPKLLVGGALALMLVAAADPFLTATEEVTGHVDSRVRIDLVDTSGSMAWEFAKTDTSKAEVAREAHLQFLEMREGKSDRVSLWLFSTYPYMVDDFVVDDELYYFQVWDAPYVTTQRLDRAMMVPADRVRIIPAEGDTNMIRALQAVIKHFDRDEATRGGSSNQNRAVLMVTDAAVDQLPEVELAELNQRNIVPYVIYINSATSGVGRSFVHPRVPGLISRIRDYGGDYFDVTDADGLTRAYEAIDAREAVRVERTHRPLKVPIYPRFLFAAMALLVVGIPLGLVAELCWGTTP